MLSFLSQHLPSFPSTLNIIINNRKHGHGSALPLGRRPLSPPLLDRLVSPSPCTESRLTFNSRSSNRLGVHYRTVLQGPSDDVLVQGYAKPHLQPLHRANVKSFSSCLCRNTDLIRDRRRQVPRTTRFEPDVPPASVEG